MSDELPKALSEALGELAPPAEAPAVREAMLAHLHATVGLGALPEAPGPAASAAHSVAGSSAGVAAKVGLALKVPWWVPVVTLVGGVGGGVGLERVRQANADSPQAVTVAVKAPEPAVESPHTPEPIAPSAPGDAGSAPPVKLVERARRPLVSPGVEPVAGIDAGARREPVDAGVVPEDTLRGERVLVDGARSALRRAPADALTLLEEHRSRFPNGQLAEEREALAIQALSGLDRGAARERLERFKVRFPGSPLAAALEALLGRAP